MKLILKEYPSVNYNHYHFPYCIYGVKEQTDSYTDIYEKGFLPYSNDLTMTEEIYYLARSVRVPLHNHYFNYKQNTIFNKFSGLYQNEFLYFSFTEKTILMRDPIFKKWCLKNAKGGFLSLERLEYILSRPYLKDILVISYDKTAFAYLFPVYEPGSFFHVWFSFYDLENQQNDFGKWILLQSINWCKRNGFKYFYIGTCYGLHALYKLMLSPNVEYFDGNDWNSDSSYLKSKIQQER